MARIAWVSTETPDRNGQGGQRRQFHQIRELSLLGHEITVIALHSHQDDTSIREWAKVVRPRIDVGGRAFHTLIRRMRRMIAGIRCDVVVVSHAESEWMLPEGLSAPVLLDMHNVLSHWHGETGNPAESASEHARETKAIARASAVTTCSEIELRRLTSRHPEMEIPAFVAPLGVDQEEWPAQVYSREQPVVGMFGSWEWLPNTRGLVWFARHVWPRIVADVPDAVARVAGNAPLQWSAWPAGMTFVGRVPDLSVFTASATVVAVPVLEGVGASMKFAESLASGAAVIATADGSNAFSEHPAFVSDDPGEWAGWIVERLRTRGSAEVPDPARAYALERLSWAEGVLPIDSWLRSTDGGARQGR